MDLIPVIHVLHSGKLYGTERMTIKIARSLSNKYSSVILTPSGLVLVEAEKHSITTKCFQNGWGLVHYLKLFLVKYSKIVFVTTSVSQSVLIIILNIFYRRHIVHLHMVHGGIEERISYGKKSWLNYLPVELIAVSNYVSERLKIHGVYSHKIKVIDNFLLKSEIEQIPKRKSFKRSGIRQIILVSRLDPIKKIDLLFDALDFSPKLNNLEFHIFGLGTDMEKLKTRAKEKHPQILLKGFSQEIWQVMANYDLLLHLCPVEPFGLAILEAMAIGLPVLIPNQGGTKDLVEHNISGFQFNANDKTDLARCLIGLQQTSPELLNSVVENAYQTIASQYSEEQGIAAYCQLFDSS